jgi:hypothetical protein
VTVEVELNPKGSVGRDPEVAESKIAIDEVEVVVETLTLSGANECASVFVATTNAEGGAALDHRKDVDQTGMISALSDDLLDSVVFSEILLLDELDLHALLGNDGLDPLLELMRQGFKMPLEVRDLDVVSPQIGIDPILVLELREDAAEDYAIPAGQHSVDQATVSMKQISHSPRIVAKPIDRLPLVPATLV